MTLFKPITGDFLGNVERTIKNTLNFEQSSLYRPYLDEEDASSESILSLYEIDNVIIQTLIPILKQSSSIRDFSRDEEHRYQFRPMGLSKAIYGMIDYWYILLAVNDYASPYEFKNFRSLLVPTQNQLESVLDQIKFNGMTMGVGSLS
jgi:hypothetical protein